MEARSVLPRRWERFALICRWRPQIFWHLKDPKVGRSSENGCCMGSLRIYSYSGYRPWILVTRQSQHVSISHVCSNVQQFWVSFALWNSSVTLFSIELGLMLLRTAKIHLIYNIFASCETNISKLVKTDTGFCIIRFLTLSPLSPSCISEFSVGQGDPGRNTFSCYIENKKYFLCAENNEVFLMVSNNPS